MKKLLSVFLGLLASSVIYSQGVTTPLQDWSTTSGSQNFFHKNITKTDASGNIYVAGATLTSAGDYDILLTKMNQGGTVLWTKQYDGSAHYHDMATDVYIDASSNVYITGVVVNDAVHHYSDCITIKYNSSGVQQWLSTYNGTGATYDAGAKVLEDGSGNVYVCGGTVNASLNRDFLALKYNSSGTQQWVREYNGTANMDDAAVKCGIVTGQLSVLGVSQATTTTYKPLQLLLNVSTGVVNTATYSSSAATSMNLVNDLVKDASGNIYLVGGTPVTGHGYDFTTIKLTSSTLAIAWEVDYNGASSLDDIASGVQVDASGNVYVTGYTTSSTQKKNMMTIKYNSSGTQQWNVIYNGALNGNDEANAIVLDASTNVYVTGYDSTSINGTDYYTIKYNSSGTQQWSIRADGDAHLEDKASDIALDTLGNVIVSGASKKLDGNYEYKTIRYVQKNIITPTDYNSEVPNPNYGYYRNGGQILNTSNAAVPNEKYYTNNTNPRYYIANTAFSIVYSKVDTIASTVDTMQRVDVTFKQGSANAKAYPLEERSDYISYFLGHIPNGVTGLHANKKMVMADIYSNVDLMYSSNQNGFKYYFIVKPGGSPTSIDQLFTGATSLSLNGTTHFLTVNTNLGSLTFDRPTVYQLTSTNTIVPITGWNADFVSSGTNSYKFNIGTYDNTKALIIEVDLGNATAPTFTTTNNLEWSTFVGASNIDELDDAKTDALANLYVTGSSKSAIFPVTPGVFATTNGGAQDVVANKFDLNGVQQWSTYIGGSLNEISGGIAFDSFHNVYVVGSTLSSDFPTFSMTGAYNDASFNNIAGWTDGFICKLDSNGQSSPWRTYYGGNRTDYFNAARIDASNNLFIVGQTASDNFPNGSTGSQYTQTCISGGLATGDQDGIMLKFNSAGVRQWATCYGGASATNGEYANDLDFDASGNLYVVGTAGTPGSGFPTLDLAGSSDYYKGTISGSTDLFIAKFNNNGDRIWATLFGGTSYEFGGSIKYNPNYNDVFVGGSTYSTDSSFIKYKSGAYNQATPGSYYDNLFLHLTPVLGRDWATYFGGVQDDFLNAITVDKHGTMYATGVTASTNFPPSGIQPHPGTTYTQPYSLLKNSYILAFDGYGETNMWTSWVGGNKDDYGSGIVTDVNDKLFVIGNSNSDTTCVIDFPLNNALGVPYFQGNCSSADGTITRFNIAPSAFTGINEIINSQDELLIYPNPANSAINVNFINNKNADVKFNMFNLLGELVQSVDMGKQNGIIFHTFDITALSQGVYFIQVQNGEQTISKKFIKQ